MPTPNYSFEKRKRELAKKAAKEAKRLRKESKTSASEEPASSDVAGSPDVSEVADQAAPTETGTSQQA